MTDSCCRFHLGLLDSPLFVELIGPRRHYCMIRLSRFTFSISLITIGAGIRDNLNNDAVIFVGSTT